LNNWCDFEKFYFDMLTRKNTSYNREVDKLNEEFDVFKKFLFAHLEEEQKRSKWIESYNSFFKKMEGNSELKMVLNFNYTNTVQQYLENKTNFQLVNIHGEVVNPENPPIFGYAADDNDCINLLNKDNKEYLRNVKKYQYKLSGNEHKLKIFLEGNKNIRVVILGHGCGISDKLILKKIFESLNVFRIQIFYYESSEDYFDRQVNINRITMNDIGRDKLLSFSDSHRMPQWNDTKNQIRAFTDYARSNI
jgi:hypothetical protein